MNISLFKKLKFNLKCRTFLRLISLGAVFLCFSNLSLCQDTEKVLFSDHIFDPNIKTVLLYPVNGENVNLLDFPVLYLQKYESLKLDFDEMGDQYKNYNYKLIHCNHDWKQSILNDFEFVQDFNEFSVDNYELSNNTRTSYIHYSITIPKVKVSGNYIIKVYRNMDQNEVVLTRRFVIYDSNVTINIEPKFSLDPARRFSHQQIDFTVNYGRYQIFNPKEMVKVVLRQNGRWDNAYYNLQPMFLREEDRLLDYHFYNNENIFPGLNEYRGFDLRSIRFGGQNVTNTTFNNLRAEAYIMPEQSRNFKNLSQWIDLNGRFVIENFETRRGNVEADYIDTYFTLNLDSPPDGDVYVFGLLTDWEIKPDFKMVPEANGKKLKGHAKIKQGFYNYSYVLVNPGMKPDEIIYEGSYMQTENRYDIIVYFRPIGARYDHVVGYKEIDYNKLR
jgi:hypothetical protein